MQRFIKSTSKLLFPSSIIITRTSSDRPDAWHRSVTLMLITINRGVEYADRGHVRIHRVGQADAKSRGRRISGICVSSQPKRRDEWCARADVLPEQRVVQSKPGRNILHQRSALNIDPNQRLHIRMLRWSDGYSKHSRRLRNPGNLRSFSGGRATAAFERAIGDAPERRSPSHYSGASLPRQFDEYNWFDNTRRASSPRGANENSEGSP